MLIHSCLIPELQHIVGMVLEKVGAAFLQQDKTVGQLCFANARQGGFDGWEDEIQIYRYSRMKKGKKDSG